MSSDLARAQLETVILPFWLERGVDDRHGGFFTCFDNRGRTLVSTDKFAWSQGRFVWLLARAADLGRRGLLDVDAEELLRLAERGARFLSDHVITDDHTTRYVVGRDGGAPQTPGQPDRSVYADWFVSLGLTELARQTGEPRWLDQALPILDRARADHLAGAAPTPPYQVPPGHSAFGPKMLLVNALLVASQAARTIGQHSHLEAQLGQAVDDALSHRLPDGTFTEMVGPDPRTLVNRHRIPGHAIEGLWMILESLELLDDARDRAPLLASISALCESAWDAEHGGLFRFTDASGPYQPTGTVTGTDYENLVRDTWAVKLWWVHSEAAATTAIAAHRYADAGAGAWFDRIWDYTIRTFPGGEHGAEWIQIRDVTGRPLDQVVALPVKDPFHITRNLMQIIELSGPGH